MLRVATSMGEGMGGQHEFRFKVRTNDPVNPESFVTVKAVFGP